MHLRQFLQRLSADELHSAYAALMCEEHDGYESYKYSIERESNTYPMIADLLGSISAELQSPGQETEETMLRLSGMLFMARAMIRLAERDQLH